MTTTKTVNTNSKIATNHKRCLKLSKSKDCGEIATNCYEHKQEG